jgi:amino acid transporter
VSTEAGISSTASGDGPDHEQGSGGLRRSIGGGLLLVFVLGDVLGAGIYALVGEIAAESGGAVWVPLLVALGLALLTACSYAELVTKYPQAGGAAVFAQRAYGRPWLSFLVGFAMLAAGVTSAAALSLAFAGDYLAQFADLPQTPVALVFLLAVALLNARGIKDSLRANLVMTLIELSGLVLVVVLAVAILGGGDGDPGQALEFKEGVNPGSAVLAASVLAFYSFVGFETSANVAEETRDPRRAYPRALLGGLVIAGVIYCLIGLAVSTALPLDELTGGGNPLLAVVEASPINVPTKVFAAIALVAVANGALLTMIMASRLTYGMARDGLLPPVLGRVLPRRRTPGVAIVATTLAAYLLLITGQLESLAETTVLLLLLVFVSANVAVLVLRKDRVEHDHFRTPWPLPVLGVLSCIVLATQQDAGNYLRAGVLLAVGLALYAVARGISSRRA